MKSYRYASFSVPSGLHTRSEVRKLIQIHWCFENISVPFSMLGENEEFVPTNSNFISRLDLMLQWAKQRLVAVEGHGDNNVQTSLMFVRGSTHCNTDSPNEHYYARKPSWSSWRSFVMEKAFLIPLQDRSLRALTRGGRWSWRQCWDPSGSLTPWSIQPKM